jgi:hypothetical protein
MAGIDTESVWRRREKKPPRTAGYIYKIRHETISMRRTESWLDGWMDA